MTRLVKVVVWDLDGTLWPGVALESDLLPEAHPAVLELLDTLAGRGILLSVASRNPASVGELVEAAPGLAGRFVAPQYGWGRKVDALRRVADELDVRLDTLAFVDDDPLERADVERTLPEVVVLAPDEVPDALGWPEFDPGPLTAAGRSRVDSYRRRERRRAARAGFGGSEEDFLRWCELRATVRAARRRGHRPARRAGPADDPVQLDRRRVPPGRPGGGAGAGRPLRRRRAGRPRGGVRHRTVRCGRPTWWRCPAGRAAGARCRSCSPGWRGCARAAGAGRLAVPCRLTERNVPIRLGLKQAGFAASARDGDTAVFVRDLDDEPAYPDWVTVDDRLVPA